MLALQTHRQVSRVQRDNQRVRSLKNCCFPHGWRTGAEFGHPATSVDGYTITSMTMAQYAIAREWARLRATAEKRELTEREKRLLAVLDPIVEGYEANEPRRAAAAAS